MTANLLEHRALRLVTLTALYVAQGIPWGFVTVGYIVLLADLGVDNTGVGVALGLAYLPWSFKVAWGPLLDAVPPLRVGRRRPFIVAAELMMGVTLLALAWVDPRDSMSTVALLLFLNNTFASLQDVAVDALAVDVLREDERGLGNSLMWAGKSLGMFGGGGGGLLVAAEIGWNSFFVAMAIAVWAIMLLPLLVRERPARPEDRPASLGLFRLAWFLIPIGAVGLIMYLLSKVDGAWVPVVQPFAAVFGAIAAWPLVDRAGFRALRRSFSFSTPWWGVIIGVVTPCGYALVQAVYTRMLRADLGLSDGRIATLTGAVEPIAGVVGALIGGLLADRIGARRALALTMVAIGICLGIWSAAPSMWSTYAFLFVWAALFYASIYAYNAASLGMFMSISNPAISATHFAIYMASTNLTYAWTAPLGGMIADAWGVAALFGVAAALQVAAIVALLPLDIGRAARVYAQPGPR